MEFDRYVIAEIEQLTDINYHNEARIMLALFLEREGFRVNDYLDSLEEILRSQHQLGYMPQTLINWRNDITDDLLDIVDANYSNGHDVYMAF